MAILKAPDQKTFSRVPQGTYAARIIAVVPEDHTKTPDQFGELGHWTLKFIWQVEDIRDEDGQSFELAQFVKFVTGDYVAKKGARIGRLPWLTEITRALGEDDIKPGEAVDTDRWIGKRAQLGVLYAREADGGDRNKISAVDTLPAARARTRPAAPGQPKSIVDYDEGDIPF